MCFCALLLCTIATLAAAAPGATCVVNPEGTGGYRTIQAAIDASSDSDIIELTDGTFSGDGNRDIGYLRKAITVRSQSGNPGSCIIDREVEYGHRGFCFHSGEDPTSVLEGVTIANGYTTFTHAAVSRGRAYDDGRIV
jgi:hypothetical protein